MKKRLLTLLINIILNLFIFLLMLVVFIAFIVLSPIVIFVYIKNKSFVKEETKEKIISFCFGAIIAVSLAAIFVAFVWNNYVWQLGV